MLAALLAHPEGATIAGLTAELGGHPNSVRLHLEGLTAGLLVEAAPEPPAGRGRPATRYRATAAARAVPPEDPAATDYRGLVSAFAEHLADGVEDPRGTSRRIGQGWGRRLMAEQPPAVASADDSIADSGPARREVIDLLGRLGFSPQPHPERPSTERLTTCPLLEVAQAHPDVVCQVHLGLVEGALTTRDDREHEVELEPFAEVGACRLRIAATEQAQGPASSPDAG